MVGATPLNGDAYMNNLLTLSFSFLLVYSSFSSIQNMESSISHSSCDHCALGTSGPCQHVFNMSCTWKEKFSCDDRCPDGYTECISNVGSSSIGVIYLVVMFACVFGSFFVQKFGPRTTFQAGFFGIMIYCIANLIASKYPGDPKIAQLTLLPASAVVGVSAALIWTAQGLYVTRTATGFAFCKGLSPNEVMGNFNGIFFGIYQCSQILGNLASSLLLKTLEWSMTGLFSFFSALAFAGITYVSFLAPLDASCGLRDDTEIELKISKEETSLLMKPDPSSSNNSILGSLFEILHLYKDRRMTLVLPISIFSGMEQAFAWGEFTSEFIKPSLGANSIGYVMTAFGAANVLGSLGLGRLSDRCGRWFTLMLCSIVLFTVYMFLYLVEISFCEQRWISLLLCACGLGLGDAAFTTIGMGAILGDSFNSNPGPAFANFQMIKSATISFLFLFKESISYQFKLVTMLFFIVFSIVVFNVFKMKRLLEYK